MEGRGTGSKEGNLPPRLTPRGPSTRVRGTYRRKSTAYTRTRSPLMYPPPISEICLRNEDCNSIRPSLRDASHRYAQDEARKTREPRPTKKTPVK